jgi:N-glycosylase/DNA lyase
MVESRFMKIQLDSSVAFNVETTLCCGQAFRWNKSAGWWYGVVGEGVLKVRQNDNDLDFENADRKFVENYFGLNDDLAEVFSKINKDRQIKDAISSFKGLRILRQDPWECLISYICATCKNISSIKLMLFALSRKFGKEVSFDGRKFYTFPSPANLADATLNELVACGLGFRAKYVSKTSKTVHENAVELENLKRETYRTTRRELLNFSGVGFKVADCVLLFSLGRLEAFPVDVWIRRVLMKHYKSHFTREFVKKTEDAKSLSSSDYTKMNAFGREYFGEYAGYAQEYLYHHERIRRRSLSTRS